MGSQHFISRVIKQQLLNISLTALRKLPLKKNILTNSFLLTIQNNTIEMVELCEEKI